MVRMPSLLATWLMLFPSLMLMKVVIYNAVLIAAQEGGTVRFDIHVATKLPKMKRKTDVAARCRGWNSFVCPSSNRVFLFESDMTQKEMLQAKIPIRTQDVLNVLAFAPRNG